MTDYDLARRAVCGLEFLGQRLYHDRTSDTVCVSRLELAAADVDVVQAIRDAITLLLTQRSTHRLDHDTRYGLGKIREWRERAEAAERDLAALQQERDDWRLAFETANEAIGKLEASRGAHVPPRAGERP